MTSPLGMHYRYLPHIGLQAAFPSYPDDWSTSYVPALRLLLSTPGEIEAVLRARDDAVDRAMGAE